MNFKDIYSLVFLHRQSTGDPKENDFFVEVEGNIKVALRVYLRDKSFDNILFFHGNGEICEEYDFIGEMFNKFDLNFIVSDFRGYGFSNGVSNRENLHSDSLKIFDYLSNYLLTNGYSRPISVMGRSLGSASACHIIANRIDEIKCCVIESGFSTEEFFFDLFNVAANNYEVKNGFENLRKISNFNKPLYIIHADNDHIVPLSNGNNLYDMCPSPDKKRLIVKNANHNNIIMILKDKYFMNIKNFIYGIN